MCLTGPIGRFLQALLGKLWLLRDGGKWRGDRTGGFGSLGCSLWCHHQEQELSVASPHALAMAPTAALCFNSNQDDLHRERWLCGYF